MDWLRRIRAAVRGGRGGARRASSRTSCALQHFAHGCARVFSADRWALVGEAGVFTDPFYSPGSDFIAMGNDYATDLIVRDARGEDIAARAEAFNTTYLRLFDAFIRLYDGQYPIMGNAQVMTAKVSWDNACYWAITALLFFQRRLRQPEFIASIEPLMRRFFVLHARMQQFLKAWDRADAGSATEHGRAERRRRRLPATAPGGARRCDRRRRRAAAAARRRTTRCSKHSRAPGRRSAAERHPALARFVAAGASNDERRPALDFAPLAPDGRPRSSVPCADARTRPV